ncbi:MAG TPA: hypothetical protein VM240_10120 [Verrucomicrobiae bacterium]|nr:hypothetical protein [Verrucomicrobiae bacterium]
MKIDIGIDKESRTAIPGGLFQPLADECTLYPKTHSFRWTAARMLRSQLQ